MPHNDATVLVVDDDPQARRGVARLIRSAGYDVKMFSSPKRFLRAPLPAGPTCVLLDMCMDGMTGLDVQDALRQNARHVPIVFLSGHGTVPTAAAGIKHGAEDFLEKPVRPNELLEAIWHAIEHDRNMSKDRGEQGELKRRYATLTPRERQVMDLVVSGLLNKQSAAELGISEKTIKVHRARVMEKMQVESLAALVQIAGRMGLAAAALPLPSREQVHASSPWQPSLP
jgi:FixJ family two-component response regulator